MAHTDGNVYPLIPDYIKMDLDVLNPVPPYVAEMEHERFKRAFGERLSFHGGIDLQHVLPFGTPSEHAGAGTGRRLHPGAHPLPHPRRLARERAGPVGCRAGARRQSVALRGSL